MSAAPQVSVVQRKSVPPKLSPVRKRAENLALAARLRMRKPMLQLMRMPERRMSRVLEKIEGLARTMNRQRLTRSNRLSSSKNVRRPPIRQPKQLLVRRRLRQKQFRQLREQASKTFKLISKTSKAEREPRRSQLRSRCNRSKRSTRISVHRQSRNRFRRLLSTRTTRFKEPKTGTVTNTKCSVHISHNGTTKVGIDRITTV